MLFGTQQRNYKSHSTILVSHILAALKQVKARQALTLGYVCYMPCYKVVGCDTSTRSVLLVSVEPGSVSISFRSVQSVRVERREYFQSGSDLLACKVESPEQLFSNNDLQLM